MGWVTATGTLAANVGASGLKEWVAGDSITAADLVADLKDDQSQAMYGLASGVLEGGVCTAAALVVTIPTDTVYFARNTWKVSGAAPTQSVPDAATTYIWGCSDGVIRTTTSTTPPATFDRRTACILTVAVAAGGVAVVNNTVQERARYFDVANRVLLEGAALWTAQADVVPALLAAMVPVSSQAWLMDNLSVYGSLLVGGKVRVE